VVDNADIFEVDQFINAWLKFLQYCCPEQTAARLEKIVSTLVLNVAQQPVKQLPDLYY